MDFCLITAQKYDFFGLLFLHHAIPAGFLGANVFDEVLRLQYFEIAGHGAFGDFGGGDYIPNIAVLMVENKLLDLDSLLAFFSFFFAGFFFRGPLIISP